MVPSQFHLLVPGFAGNFPENSGKFVGISPIPLTHPLITHSTEHPQNFKNDFIDHENVIKCTSNYILLTTPFIHVLLGIIQGNRHNEYKIHLSIHGILECIYAFMHKLYRCIVIVNALHDCVQKYSYE